MSYSEKVSHTSMGQVDFVCSLLIGCEGGMRGCVSHKQLMHTCAHTPLRTTFTSLRIASLQSPTWLHFESSLLCSFPTPAASVVLLCLLGNSNFFHILVSTAIGRCASSDPQPCSISHLTDQYLQLASLMHHDDVF